MTHKQPARFGTIVFALVVVGCRTSPPNARTLESLLPPPSSFTGECSPAPAKDGYSNPHVSADAAFLKTASVLGGDGFPQADVRVAALAWYGSPMKAGLALYGFADDSAAKRAIDALRKQSNAKSDVYRTEMYRQRLVVATAWEHRGEDPSCLTPILRHLEAVLR